MFYSARKSQRVAENPESFRYFFSRLQSLDFDDAAAEEYGLIRATLERAGTPVGSNDCLIAAIVRAHDLTFVTHNTREFVRIPALQLEHCHG
jgi:tRNA(fMet)-specific endonuclease VapC